jgi:arginase/N-omega-hydroxy-L-arginine amidinohydrolase
MNIHPRSLTPFLRPADAPAVKRPAVMALTGYVCDRYTHGGMEGASLLGQAAAERLGIPLRALGAPGPAKNLGWRECLAEAAPYLREVAREMDALAREDALPLIFASRCGTSLATLPVLLRKRKDAKLLWLDAHGDFHTPETTPTSYLGGMVLTALCGLWDSGFGAGVSPERIILAGTRDIDPGEAALIAAGGVKMIAAQNGEIGERQVLEAAGGAPVLIHIDTDVVDPRYLPAEYKVPEGLRPSAVHALLRALCEKNEIAGLEVTEFEAPADPAGRARAVRTVMRMIAPVLCAAAGSKPRV